ncbi:hypothetical protein ABID23_001604, partial [Bartonella silvatica]
KLNSGMALIMVLMQDFKETTYKKDL